MPAFIQPLDYETRGAINHEIARWLGVDGQSAHRSDYLNVEEIELFYMDENDHENPITGLKGEELHGPNASLDGIVSIIESAACRDALTRFGNCVYVLYFHLKGGQKNRGRFPFITPGSGHTVRGSGEGSALARRNGRNGGADAMDSQTAAEALRVTVELLRWSTEERKVNDDRSANLFSSFEKVLRQQNEVIQNYSDREMRIIELEGTLNERKYELEQKRKADEEKSKWMSEAIEVAKTYGPMLLPPVIETIRKFNNGPNYVPNETTVFEKIKKAQEAAARAAKENGEGEGDETAPSNGATNGTNGAAAHAGPSDEERAAAAVQVQGRIALDLCRLIALAKSTQSDVIMREAMKDHAEILQVFEAIVVATAALDAHERVDDLVQMALGFGGALQQNPVLAVKIVTSIQNPFMRATLIEFSELLKQYVKFMGLG